MPMRTLIAGTLGVALGLSPLLPGPANAQGRRGQAESNANVTSDGYDRLAYGKTFYLEVPMIDAPPMVEVLGAESSGGGIGMNITAESIINSVRYAGGQPDINHVVFLMRTGGGKMFHAEAMKDVIEEFHRTTEFHIIIDDAISAGTWTVFSCDTIFMVDGGSVGGAVIYVNLPDGTVKESPDIPAVAARMAQLAERNGHPGALLPAMMHLPAELHYWEEDGEPVLSGRPPASSGSIRNHQELDSSSNVLTLTSSQAVEIGLADRLRGFDATLVGDEIGAPGWTRANHYGQVVHEIGEVYNVTRQEQDRFEERLRAIPFFRDNRDNREIPQIANALEGREIFQTLVDAYEQINEALNNLPYVHPERHIYFTGEDGRTILADPEQWEADKRACREYTRNLLTGFRTLRSAYRLAEVDSDNLNDMEEAIQLIIERITGIGQQGNAAYWLEHPVDYDTE